MFVGLRYGKAPKGMAACNAEAHVEDESEAKGCSEGAVAGLRSPRVAGLAWFGDEENQLPSMYMNSSLLLHLRS